MALGNSDESFNTPIDLHYVLRSPRNSWRRFHQGAQLLLNFLLGGNRIVRAHIQCITSYTDGDTFLINIHQTVVRIGSHITRHCSHCNTFHTVRLPPSTPIRPPHRTPDVSLSDFSRSRLHIQCPADDP